MAAALLGGLACPLSSRIRVRYRVLHAPAVPLRQTCQPGQGSYCASLVPSLWGQGLFWRRPAKQAVSGGWPTRALLHLRRAALDWRASCRCLCTGSRARPGAGTVLAKAFNLVQGGLRGKLLCAASCEAPPSGAPCADSCREGATVLWGLGDYIG